MNKNKALLPLLAFMLCVGTLFIPLAAHAQTADTTPPTLTVTLNGGILIATAKDDESGVAAIHVNDYRFSTLINGTAYVNLYDYGGTGAQIAVFATDRAGNRSQPIVIDNPYYRNATARPTTTAAAGAATPGPSSAGTATASPSGTAAPGATPFPSFSVPEPANPVSGTAASGGANPFTPSGGGSVLDNAGTTDGKEFFTVTATDGSVYYLIIDRQRGSENVYFLSAVTRADLLGLTDGGTISGPEPIQPEPITPQDPAATEAPQAAEPEPAKEGGGVKIGTIIFIVLAAGIVGGVAYYFKVVKPRKAATQADAYEEAEGDPGDEGADDGYYFDETDEYEPGAPED